MTEQIAPLDGQDRFMATPERADIVAYSLAWNTDHPNKGEELSDASVHVRVFLNGREIEHVSRLEVSADSGFTEVKIRLCPTSVRFEALPFDDWEALGKEPV